ncbi:MAG: BrnA antitoxin family protein, partial [Devosia sp.]|nr:BrnA antitoxin family protein [Devosia sp.]
SPKAAVTLRLDPTTVARFEEVGPDWRRRMADILDKAKP